MDSFVQNYLVDGLCFLVYRVCGGEGYGQEVGPLWVLL
jgi:hypothetical protein